MLEYLPSSVNVGVINVSIGGCRIELFDKEKTDSYVATVAPNWMKNMIKSMTGILQTTSRYGKIGTERRCYQRDLPIKGSRIRMILLDKEG
jgi:hypothetical protein